MNSRERVLTAIDLKKPDRTPCLLYGEVMGYVPVIKRLLKQKCTPKSALEYFQMDITSVAFNPTRLPLSRFEKWLPKEILVSAEENASNHITVSEWGDWWRGTGFYHLAQIESPLKEIDTIEKIKEFCWPDLDQPYRFAGLREQIESVHSRGLAVAIFGGSIFEQAWYLRGMDRLMEDMLLNPQTADYLLDKTAYYQEQVSVALAKAGCDIIILGDDVGSQTSLLMSIDMWRHYLKERLRKTIKAIKIFSPHTKVFYHSDGNIEQIIPELIEIGVDILNPVQPECMDPAEVKAVYGKELAFWGTVSVQNTMPFGTAEQVRQEVLTRIATVGYDGGLILAPAHVLGPEVPWENIAAFFETAREI